MKLDTIFQLNHKILAIEQLFQRFANFNQNLPKKLSTKFKDKIKFN